MRGLEQPSRHLVLPLTKRHVHIRPTLLEAKPGGEPVQVAHDVRAWGQDKVQRYRRRRIAKHLQQQVERIQRAIAVRELVAIREVLPHKVVDRHLHSVRPQAFDHQELHEEGLVQLCPVERELFLLRGGVVVPVPESRTRFDHVVWQILKVAQAGQRSDRVPGRVREPLRQRVLPAHPLKRRLKEKVERLVAPVPAARKLAALHEVEGELRQEQLLVPFEEPA
mmetsp:Transcript_21404/g.60998  ORF Transcript_21404/g.60998 Transcript_21404/m.60998 type:complete len:223 (+) Transcript_21404:1763-2431(+)